MNSSVKLKVLLDRSDASCFFPQGPRKSPTPVEMKEKVPKGTLKGVAEHVKIFNERGILRSPPETFNDLETDCDPLFHPYGSLFLAHDPLMFATFNARICGSKTCASKMRVVARILRPKSPMKMQVPYVSYFCFCFYSMHLLLSYLLTLLACTPTQCFLLACTLAQSPSNSATLRRTPGNAFSTRNIPYFPSSFLSS